jgi:putative phosphoribosyl transferase
MVSDRSGLETRSVTIAAGEVQLAGDLTLPEVPKAIVLFAHGSGSSRHSRRNQFVARQLAKSGLATLLFDLLTPEECAERATYRGTPPSLTAMSRASMS